MKRIYVKEEWCLGCHLCEYECAYANSGTHNIVLALKDKAIDPNVKVQEDGKITFSSSNENVVKVDAETGVLTVIGAGTATITVSGAETDYRLAPTTSYTVFIEKATPVIAFPAAEINAVYGETVPLNQLTVTWYEGTVTYASADEQKATVTAEGVVTTKGAGDVVIKGIAPETNNFKRGEVTYVLHIDKARPTFAFEKDGLTAVLGQPVPENKLAVGLYDGDIIYTSSCDSIATVDSLGVVTANVPGPRR